MWVTALVAFSVLTLVASAVGLPWLLARLPADYLVRPPAAKGSPGRRLALKIARNALATVVLLAGVAMLVLPGQGLLTMAAALILFDAKGKRRLERRLLTHPRVLRTVNRIRRRARRDPLLAPE